VPKGGRPFSFRAHVRTLVCGLPVTPFANLQKVRILVLPSVGRGPRRLQPSPTIVEQKRNALRFSKVAHVQDCCLRLLPVCGKKSASTLPGLRAQMTTSSHFLQLGCQLVHAGFLAALMLAMSVMIVIIIIVWMPPRHGARPDWSRVRPAHGHPGVNSLACSEGQQPGVSCRNAQRMRRG